MRFTKDQTDALRYRVREILSDFRFSHVLGVERTAVIMADLFCPEKESLLRAAALLHDVTKEKSLEEQLDIINKHAFKPTALQLAVVPTLHALTAPLIIPEEFPEFADKELLDAIRYHSTGRADMTLSEKIIYLSDYIEDTRKFEDCIALRQEFFAPDLEKMSLAERLLHLDRVLLHAIDITVADLEEKGRIIDEDTLFARESLARAIGL